MGLVHSLYRQKKKTVQHSTSLARYRRRDEHTCDVCDRALSVCPGISPASSGQISTYGSRTLPSTTKCRQCKTKGDSFKSSNSIDGRRIHHGLSANELSVLRSRSTVSDKSGGDILREGSYPECHPKRHGMYADTSDEDEVDTLYDSIPCRSTPGTGDSGMGHSTQTISSIRRKETVDVGTCMSREGSVRYDRLKDVTTSKKQNIGVTATDDEEYNVFEARCGSSSHESPDDSDSNDTDNSDYENGPQGGTESVSNTDGLAECSDRKSNVYAKVRKTAVISGVVEPTLEDTRDAPQQITERQDEPSIVVNTNHTVRAIEKGDHPSASSVGDRKNADPLRQPLYLAKHRAPRDSGVSTMQNTPRTSQLSNSECSQSSERENMPQFNEVGPELVQPDKQASVPPVREVSSELGQSDTDCTKPANKTPIGKFIPKLPEPVLDYDKLYDRSSCESFDDEYEMNPVHHDNVANSGYAPGSSEDTLMTGNQTAQRSDKKSNVLTGRVNPSKPHIASKVVTQPQASTQSNQATIDRSTPQINQRSNLTNSQGQGVAMDYEDSYLTTEQQTPGCEEFTVTVNSDGGNFRSELLRLSGSVPEGAVSADYPVILRFVGAPPENYQNQIPAAVKFVSRIYHFLPHGITFHQAVMFKFMHRGKTRPGGPRSRLRLIYSETAPGEVADWKLFDPAQISNAQKGMNVLLTESFVCLFLSRFCMYGVVEEEIPSLFTDVAVYGKHYPHEGKIKLTVNVGAKKQSDLQKGNQIADESLRVWSDIDDIVITIQSEIDNVVVMQRPPLRQTLNSYYVMNEKQSKATYLLMPKKTCDFLNCVITIKHLEEKEIYVTEALSDLDTAGCSQLSPTSTLGYHSLPSRERAGDGRPDLTHTMAIEEETDCAVKRRLSDDTTTPKKSDPTCAFWGSASQTKAHGSAQVMVSPMTERDIPEVVQRYVGEGESGSGESHADDKGTFQNIHGVPAEQQAIVPLPHQQQKSEVASCKDKDWPQQVRNHGQCTINVYNNYNNCSAVDSGPLCPGNKRYLKDAKLSHGTKIKLGQKLDLEIPSGKDWRAFAGVLGYDGHLHQFGENPTYKLLQIWENTDGPEGSLRYLIHCLEKIDRRDAAQLVREDSEGNVSMC